MNIEWNNSIFMMGGKIDFSSSKERRMNAFWSESLLLLDVLITSLDPEQYELTNVHSQAHGDVS